MEIRNYGGCTAYTKEYNAPTPESSQPVYSVQIDQGHSGPIMRVILGVIGDEHRALVATLQEGGVKKAFAAKAWDPGFAEETRPHTDVVTTIILGGDASAATKALDVMQEKKYVTPEFAAAVKEDLPRAIEHAATCAKPVAAGRDSGRY